MSEAASLGARSATAPPIAILGVPFDNVTTAETVGLIEDMVASGRPHYLATANVDFLVQALHDVELRRILFEAHLVLCDGTPLVWASRLLGNPLPERVAGSDLVPLLIRFAAEKGYTLYFLGGAPEVTKEATEKIRARHPNIRIVGHFSPPVSQLLEIDHDEIRRRIQQARPDLLFVSFGCPKQEKWIAMHYRELGVPVSVGVGATIDFLAGRVLRAPVWMQKTGTEWLFRLAQEPRRLFRRYVKDLWHFGCGILAQLWRLQLRQGFRQGAEGDAPRRSSMDEQRVTLSSRLDMESVQHEAAFWNQVLAGDRHCLLEGGNVSFIDSTGVGLLIRLQKRMRATGRQLILVRPSPAIQHALELMRLRDFFAAAQDEQAARVLMEQLNTEQAVVTLLTAADEDVQMFWQGELTAVNAESVRTQTQAQVARAAQTHRRIVVDLARLRFIDSTGVGVMIRLKKSAARDGVTLGFANPQDNVLNVLQLTKLKGYLLGES